jgi:hypothetical protein
VSLRYLKPVKSDKVGQIHSSELKAPIAQLAEAADLKSVQCRFESDWGHEAIGGICADKANFRLRTTVRFRLSRPHFGHRIRNCVQIGIEQIGIHIERHRRAGVPQHPLHNLRVRAGADTRLHLLRLGGGREVPPVPGISPHPTSTLARGGRKSSSTTTFRSPNGVSSGPMNASSRQRLLTSRTPGGDWAEVETRWRRWRWWWRISLKNIRSDIALPGLDVPVGVADIRVPDDRVHTKITGLHGRISWAPATWACRVVFWAAGPGLRCRTGLGLGGTCAHHPRDTAPQQHSRCEPND